MGKAPEKRRLKNCPYVVLVTCDLTPPYNFIQQTQHTTYQTAKKKMTEARRVFDGCPGLKIELIRPVKHRKTAWEWVLGVKGDG